MSQECFPYESREKLHHISTIEQQAERIKELTEELIALRAENAELRKTLSDIRIPLAFWESCNTEFKSAYTALLKIIDAAIDAEKS